MQYFKHFFWVILGLAFITLSIKAPLGNLVEYDLLPDTLGYIFITTGLAGLAKYSRWFSYARFFTVPLGLMSIVTYGNISKHYFDLFAMQFTVVFGFFFTVCIIFLFVFLLMGMKKLYYAYELEDKIFGTMTCFIFAIVVNVIAAFMTLPTMKEMVMDNANGTILFVASAVSAVWLVVRLWKSAADLENKFNEKTFIIT